MKHIINFSSVLAKQGQTQKPVVFNEVDGGIRARMVLFSTAWNRNNAFFQVSDLLKWQNKLEKLLFNINHDLNLTGGQYLGNRTKFVKGSMKGEFNDGAFEVSAVFESTDPAVISRKDEITAPSIELEVDGDSYKEFVDGSGVYFTNYEFVGCALLLGLKAGSGDARLIGDIETFCQKIKNNNMYKKEELKQYFATDEGKQVFNEIIGEYETKTTMVDKFITPDGRKLKVEGESTYKEIVTEIKEELKDDLVEFIQKKFEEAKEKQEENTDAEGNEPEKTEPKHEEGQGEEPAGEAPKTENNEEDQSESAEEAKTKKEFANAGEPKPEGEKDKPDGDATKVNAKFQKVPDQGQDDAENTDNEAKTEEAPKTTNFLKKLIK